MQLPVFGADIDNIEFSPRVLQPTSYWKVKSKNKSVRELDKLFLAQNLRLDDSSGESTSTKPTRDSKEPQDKDAVWTLAFSLDGRYLAAAGQNGLIKVWAVLKSPEEREAQDWEDDENAGDDGVQLRAPVFKRTPVRRYADHEGPILDIQWSKVTLTTSG
jgi:WD40 repeat protein